MARKTSSTSDSTANLGFEAKLWLAADKLRNNMDAAEYKHVLLSIYGQESNATTRRLALMNLAIRGIEGDLGPEHADTFRRDLHPDLRADFAPRPEYSHIPGFCKSATTAETAAHGYVLTPGRCVGAEEVEDDGEPFAEKMPRLVAELQGQFAESAKLERAIKANLRGLGYGLQAGTIQLVFNFELVEAVMRRGIQLHCHLVDRSV